MASLKRSQFKHVYAITFEDKFASILTAASETGAIGSDYLYLFCGLTGSTLFEQLQVKHGTFCNWSCDISLLVVESQL
jgi:hypothetical protein